MHVETCSPRNLRIVLFTVNDLQFVPTLIQPLLDRFDASIVKAFVSKSFPPDLGYVMQRAGFLLRNGYPFCIRPDDLFRLALMQRQGRQASGAANMVEYLSARGIDTEWIREIRTGKTRRRLAALEPDAFLFAPFDKIAGPKFLDLPKRGTYNVHLGKLPDYRGGYSAFWVLRFGDQEAGASVHVAIPELDKGAIVEEVRLPVKTHTMKQLMMDTVTAAGPAIVRALDKVAEGRYDAVDTSRRSEAYYSIPTWTDMREFYKRGCRLL